MLKTFLLLAVFFAASGADDPWARVRELKSGAELRIYKTGEKAPVTARFDALSGEALIVVEKNAQIAIAKDRIERIDCRAGQSGSRVAMETRKVIGDRESSTTGRVKDSNLPPRSTSSGIKIQPKPGFETVYRRDGSQ